MSFNGKHGPNPFMGYHGSDAAATSFVQSLNLDLTHDGLSNPYESMWYWNTTDSRVRIWKGSTFG